MGEGWGSFHVVPIETGRGCPYGCEFCTVTGFFGDSIRFRSNESVVEELLRLKKRAKREKGQMAVFFIDDNLAINKKRLKSLLRDIIAADAQLPWVAQISANLLGDEELVDLIAEAGGKWVFIGMESIDPANMASVNKNFSKPGDYKEVLDRLAKRNIYAITSFIFGMDNDTPGRCDPDRRADRKLGAGTSGFRAAHAVSGDTALHAARKGGQAFAAETLAGVRAVRNGAHAVENDHRGSQERGKVYAWSSSYSPERNAQALEAIKDQPLQYKLSHFVSRMFFRGIYFPQMRRREWLMLFYQNRKSIFGLVKEGFSTWRQARRNSKIQTDALPTVEQA